MAPRSKKGKLSYIIPLYISITILVICILIGLYITLRGAVNYDRLRSCKLSQKNSFCGIQEINLSIPADIRDQILDKVDTTGKRVVIPGWKAGRTISTGDVTTNIPDLWNWYEGLEDQISKIIGEEVHVTDKSLPTSCAVLIYEEDGDFINWHYDVNYFNGRFFTLLIPVTFENDCTKYTYYDMNNQKKQIGCTPGNAILFEGDKTFHMATKYCKNNRKRVVVSVQFSTDPTITWYNKLFMRIKDSAYIWV